MKSALPPEDQWKPVIEIICDQLDVAPSQVTEDARFEEDLGADSLDMVQINMAIEERLRITIPDEKAEKIVKVGDVFEALAEL